MWWYILAAPTKGDLNKIAGWSSQVARQAHNLKAAGSNPAPATLKKAVEITQRLFPFPKKYTYRYVQQGASQCSA